MVPDVRLVVRQRRPVGADGQQGAVGGEQVGVREAQLAGLQQQELALQVVEAEAVPVEREQLAAGERVELRARSRPARRPQMLPVARHRGDRDDWCPRDRRRGCRYASATSRIERRRPTCIALKVLA